MVLFQSWHDVLRGETWLPCIIVSVTVTFMLIITSLLVLEWIFSILSGTTCGYLFYIYNWMHCSVMTIFYALMWVVATKEVFFYRLGASGRLLNISLIVFFLMNILFAIAGMIMLFYVNGCVSFIEYRLFMVIFISSIVIALIFTINVRKLI
jgi:hypothetical protein